MRPIFKPFQLCQAGRLFLVSAGLPPDVLNDSTWQHVIATRKSAQSLHVAICASLHVAITRACLYNDFERGVYMTKGYEQRKASNERYLAKLDRVVFRVPLGEKDKIQEHAARMGESANSFLIRAVEETIERDKLKRG